MPDPTPPQVELTVTEDPVTGTWTFTLHGHRIEIEPTHGFVKIDGTLHHAPPLQGLHDIQDLAGQPLEYLTSLLTAKTPSTPQERPAPPRPPAKDKEQGPRKTPRAQPSTPAKPPAPTENTERTVLPTQAAAAYLGLSPKTLETLRTRGGGPPFLKLGRRVVYRKADLELWLAQRVRRSTSDPG